MNKNNIERNWYCPLLKHEIEDGYCLGINYQRLDYFTPDILIEVKKVTNKFIVEISNKCEKCQKLPLTE